MGHGVIVPMSKGDFILPNRLAGENAGSGLPSLIPPGDAGRLGAGERNCFGRGICDSGNPRRCSSDRNPGWLWRAANYYVLQNVAVLASGHTLGRTSTGEAQNAAVITLLGSPDDAQRLTLASTKGISSWHYATHSISSRTMCRLRIRGGCTAGMPAPAGRRMPIRHIVPAQ